MIATFPTQSPFHVHPFQSRLSSLSSHSLDVTPLSPATLTLSPKSAFLSKENKTRPGHEAEQKTQHMDQDTVGGNGGLTRRGIGMGIEGPIMPHASFTVTSHQPPTSTQLSSSPSSNHEGNTDPLSTTTNDPSDTTKENTSRNSSRGKFRKPIYNRSRHTSSRMPRIHTSPQELWQIVSASANVNAQKPSGSTFASHALAGSSPPVSPRAGLGYSPSASVEANAGKKYPRIQDEVLPRSRTMTLAATPGMVPSTSPAPSSPRMATIPLPSAPPKPKSSSNVIPKAIGSERRSRQRQDSELTLRARRDGESSIHLLDHGDRITPDQALSLLTSPIASLAGPASPVLRDLNAPSSLRRSKRFSPQIELEPVELPLRSFASSESVSENIPLKPLTLTSAPTIPSAPLTIRLPKPRRLPADSQIQDQPIFLTDPLQQALKYEAIAQFNAQRKRGQRYAPRFSSTLNPAREALSDENGLCFTDYAHVEHFSSDDKGRLRNGLHWNYFRPVQVAGSRLRSTCESHNRSACASGNSFSTYLRGGDQKHCLGCRRDGLRVRLLIVGLWKWTALHGAKFDIDYYWSDEDSDDEDCEEDADFNVGSRRGRKDFPMDVMDVDVSFSDSVLDLGRQSTLDMEMKKAASGSQPSTGLDMEVDVDLQFKLAPSSSGEWDGDVPDSPRLRDLDDFDDI
ncbi:hypothetical protein VNI00_007796 [Paramarasmius palmivorus]|uniref:Uncharacterized protein n=1 Tax=Paramarasmius palmivorus TaxID=297713 RepID=A0AAW0CZB7_9AGAR